MGGFGHNPAQIYDHSRNRGRWVIWILMAWGILCTLALLALLSAESFRIPLFHLHKPHAAPGQSPIESLPSKRNVIFMVSDGMGPAAVAMARNYYQFTADAGLDTLFLDQHFVGNSRTQSSDSFVTDSAAGATAFSCGLKTYNGAIGVDPESKPCASIMEAAKLEGFKTGLVVTTRITDATPASFASHAHDRSEEDFIAEQLINYDNTHPFGDMVDLMFGGGSCHFLANSQAGSCRGNDIDLIADAKERGWHFFDNGKALREFDTLNPQLPVLGLFAPGDLPFSIDYPEDPHGEGLPHLKESATKAAHALGNATKDSDNGFFLMVEGSRIDHAGHTNDPGAQVREVMAYSEAFEAMVKYAEQSEVPTIVVSTSDHETGGLSVSRQVSSAYPEYLWYPDVLQVAQHSTEYLSRELRHFASQLDLSSKDDDEKLVEYIKLHILGEKGLGFPHIEEKILYLVRDRAGNSHDILAQLQSIKAEVGWATHGHSAVDVNVYAASNHPQALLPIYGGNENTDLGHYMRVFIGISHEKLNSLTAELRKKFGDRF